jgi:hypothetical protein
MKNFLAGFLSKHSKLLISVGEESCMAVFEGFLPILRRISSGLERGGF